MLAALAACQQYSNGHWETGVTLGESENPSDAADPVSDFARGDAKAAKLSGIKTERLAFYTFVNMGMLAALADFLFAARLNTATPKAGLGFELDVIAARFVGGASVSGGVGRVMGAVTGAFIMDVMNNGVSILGIDYQQVIRCLVLLAAVYVDLYNKKK